MLNRFHNCVYENVKLENRVVNKNENLLLIDFEHRSSCREKFRAPEADRRDIAERLKEAQEMATIFSVAKTLTIVWKTTSTDKYPENRDKRTCFTAATEAVPHRWKGFILQCMKPDPNRRRPLTKLFSFFDNEMIREWKRSGGERLTGTAMTEAKGKRTKKRKRSKSARRM